jgi:hypothetical protein
VEPQALIGPRDGHHHDVLEADGLHPDRGDAMVTREAVQLRLHGLREAVPPERATRDGEDACVQAVALGRWIERHQLLGHEHAEDVQAGAGDQAEGAGNRVDAEGLLAPAEQAEDGHRPRHRGNLPYLGRPRGDLTRGSAVERPAVVYALIVEALSIYNDIHHIDNGSLSWSDGEAQGGERAPWRA